MKINMIISKRDKQTIEDVIFGSLPNTSSDFCNKYINHFISHDVYKISMCITEIANSEFVPGWFLNCNGKLFFDNCNLIQ